MVLAPKKLNSQVDLNDIILSSDQLKEMAADSRLFEVKYQNEIKGIALDQDLKNFFSVVQDDLAEFKFYSVREVYLNQEGQLAANQEFIHAQKHPYFQRRRPQVQGQLETTGDTQVWIVDHGHKAGPFSILELQEKIKQNQLHLSDLVSVDEGHTWGKVYQLKGFDRRELNAQKLPQGPSVMLLNNEEASAEKQLRYTKNKKGEWDAIAGLSYLGQGRHLQNKSIWDEKLSESPDEEVIAATEIKGDHTPTEQKNSLLKIGLLLALFVALLGVLVNYINTPENKEATANKKSSETQSNQNNLPQMPGEVPAKKPLKKNPGRQSPSVGEKRPSTKNKVDDGNYENVPEENFYYDDGSTPYEQDPVRKKLGRDLVNPRISPFDGRPKGENAEGIFGSGRGPASGSEEGLFEQEAEL